MYIKELKKDTIIFCNQKYEARTNSRWYFLATHFCGSCNTRDVDLVIDVVECNV